MKNPQESVFTIFYNPKRADEVKKALDMALVFGGVGYAFKTCPSQTQNSSYYPVGALVNGNRYTYEDFMESKDKVIKELTECKRGTIENIIRTEAERISKKICDKT